MAKESKIGKFLSGFLGSTTGSGANARKAAYRKSLSDVAPNDFGPSGFLGGTKLPIPPNTPRGRAIRSTWGAKK